MNKKDQLTIYYDTCRVLQTEDLKPVPRHDLNNLIAGLDCCLQEIECPDEDTEEFIDAVLEETKPKIQIIINSL